MSRACAEKRSVTVIIQRFSRERQAACGPGMGFCRGAAQNGCNFDGKAENFTKRLQNLILCLKNCLTSTSAVKYTIIAFAWNDAPRLARLNYV